MLLVYIAIPSEGNNPMIYKHMIQMAQSKIYWWLNVQSQGGSSNLTYSSNYLKIYLENWLKLPAYIATSSEGNNPMII